MDEWLHIDTDLFHFLRPEWLWLFAPMLLIIIITLTGNKSKKSWKKTIAPHLRPYIIGKGSKYALLGPLALFIVICSILIISTAGPTWKKVEIPGTKSEAILLIGLDLSMSMLVEDVSPNRLERAKFKIRDLLDANPGSKVGLFVYAGTVHPVITPCKDYKLVKYQIESLSPKIMPLQGTNLSEALKFADTAFAKTEAPSTLLLLTDNIDSEETNLLLDFVEGSNDNIELMTFATPQGGKIPTRRKGSFYKENGEFVISKLNQNSLFTLQKNQQINVNTLTLDKTDVEAIAKKVKKNLIYSEKDKDSDKDWQEMGYNLIWIVAVLFMFWFRKGWMLQLSLIAFVFTSCSNNVDNSKVEKWEDLWYTSDYQAQKQMDENDYEAAAENYTSINHKGTAYYKAGNYEAAIQLFSQDTTASSMYNLGLAYAANGQNDRAEEALLLAQKMDPKNEAIQHTLVKNEQVIKQNDSLRGLNPDTAIALKEEKKNKGKLNEREAQSKDDELTSDTETKELPKDGDRITDEVESGIHTADEMEKPPENFQQQEGKAATNILLREISAEPSEFLKRRFKYQYDKYFKEIPKPTKSW